MSRSGVKWPRVGLREERWATRPLVLQADGLLLPDGAVPLSDVVQVEAACGIKGALARFVLAEGEDVLVIVSSWRRLRTALESIGFKAYARKSYPDRLLFVPGGAEPQWDNLRE